jgi:sulfite reductase (NADPH) flavoprotein alpha-component
MLIQNKLKILLDLIGTSTKEELIWMNGYLSAIVAKQNEQEAVPATKPAVNKITIAYGTETGNSKRLAADFAVKAKKIGIHAKLVSLDQYRPTDLSKEEYFLTIISTHGDGEPPAAAKKFYEHIHQNGFKLDKLKYGVLALGDTAYPLFCKTGEDVDVQLNKLGGERFVSLQKCDIDYQSDAESWFSDVLQKLSTNGNGNGTITVKPSLPKKSTGKKIYTGTVLANIMLNDKGSKKETHHIEIASEDIDYQPGDSIGIVPENHTDSVEEIFAVAGVDKNKSCLYRNESITLFELLKKKISIVYLPERVVKKYAAIVEQEIPETRIGLLDLLKIYPLKESVQFEEVISILEPIAPRLYSIASSPEAHGSEVHLTVAKDIFRINDQVKYGLCSDCLSQLPVNSTINFYVHPNGQFRLPEENKDIIMIGPGTGVAPFRSFLAERDATGASGRNWLFFGDQHFTTDFLYQTEMQSWIETGVLTKMNVAFSRDQDEKIYVQNKMMKYSREFFEWVESGAYLYLCGAKEPMSVDVENTILQIIEQEGEKTREQSEEYLSVLKEEGRYVKDVY